MLWNELKQKELAGALTQCREELLSVADYSADRQFLLNIVVKIDYVIDAMKVKE